MKPMLTILGAEFIFSLLGMITFNVILVLMALVEVAVYGYIFAVTYSLYDVFKREHKQAVSAHYLPNVGSFTA